MNPLSLAKCALDVHHSGMPWWGFALISLGIGAFVAGVLTFLFAIDPPPFIHEISDSECAVLAIATVLFWPIGGAAVVLWCIWKAPRTLYTGVRDLRARVRRADPPIPPASVHRTDPAVVPPTSDVSK